MVNFFYCVVKYNDNKKINLTLHGFFATGGFFLCEFFRLSLDTLKDFNLACSIALLTILSVGCILGSQ